MVVVGGGVVAAARTESTDTSCLCVVCCPFACCLCKRVVCVCVACGGACYLCIVVCVVCVIVCLLEKKKPTSLRQRRGPIDSDASTCIHIRPSLGCYSLLHCIQANTHPFDNDGRTRPTKQHASPTPRFKTNQIKEHAMAMRTSHYMSLCVATSAAPKWASVAAHDKPPTKKHKSS